MFRSQAKTVAAAPALSLAWVIPNATVFISSAAIMMIELVAGRIIARHLGASVYTWTSVIGICLAGIAVGNYLGGLLADKYASRRMLSRLFMLGSIMSGAISLLDRFAEDLSPLWTLSWPTRVASHVSIVFFVPTMFLGMISPVIAKMALDLGRERGRTIGDIYAFGVVGSLIGTFLAGFFLIAALGTLGVVWMVAVILAVMAILYDRRNPIPWAWAVASLVLSALSVSQTDGLRLWGERLMLRPVKSPAVLYSTESDYSYIQVVEISKEPPLLGMHLDTLLHSQLNPQLPGDFKYEYEKVYLAITKRLRPGATKIDSLTIGGGGYVYPRYMNMLWPEGRTDVVEIDPAVTEAAMAAFGVPRDTTMNCFHEDGRVYIDRLLDEKKAGKAVPLYDFIYCDAVNDYSVPHQLTTREFMLKVHELIKPDGAYLMNMIDIYESDRFEAGLLLGSLITTMKDVFPHVNVFLEGSHLTTPDGRPNAAARGLRSTYIIAGTNMPFDTSGLGPVYAPECEITALSATEIEDVQRRASRLVLTDEFAPVENLLAGVVKDSAIHKAIEEWDSRAKRKAMAKNYDEAIEICEYALNRFPDINMSFRLVETLGTALMEKQDYYEAIAKFKKILDRNPNYEPAHAKLAACYNALNDGPGALPHFQFLARANPESPDALYNVAVSLMNANRLPEAIQQFESLVERYPDYCDGYVNLGTSYLRAKRFPRLALAAYRRALACKPGHEIARNAMDELLQIDSAAMEARAADLSTQAADRPGDAAILTQLLDTYWSLKLFEETVATADKLIAVQPGAVDAHLKRANALVELQRLEEARAGFLRVLEIDPSQTGVQETINRIDAYLSQQKASTPAPTNP